MNFKISLYSVCAFLLVISNKYAYLYMPVHIDYVDQAMQSQNEAEEMRQLLLFLCHFFFCNPAKYYHHIINCYIFTLLHNVHCAHKREQVYNNNRSGITLIILLNINNIFTDIFILKYNSAFLRLSKCLNSLLFYKRLYKIVTYLVAFLYKIE